MATRHQDGSVTLSKKEFSDTIATMNRRIYQKDIFDALEENY